MPFAKQKRRSGLRGPGASGPWWGSGQGPEVCPLTLKRRRINSKGEAEPDFYIPSPSEAAFRAAKDASRAIPLSWEITDFPTHGEPQTVCRSVAALKFTGSWRLRLGSC